MKKLLAILAMVLFIGCAGPTSGTKKEVVAPPPAPSQEEVLKQSKAEVEMKEFVEWWQAETPMFTVFIMMQMPVEVTIETKKLELLFDGQIGMIWVRLENPKNPADFADMYVVATKPNGKWGVATIVVKDLEEQTDRPEASEETTEVEEPNEHKL